MFQSLFYWKLLWKRGRNDDFAFMDEARFNPCSIGNCSGRISASLSTNDFLRVSILVLLEIALEASVPPAVVL